MPTVVKGDRTPRAVRREQAAGGDAKGAGEAPGGPRGDRGRGCADLPQAAQPRRTRDCLARPSASWSWRSCGTSTRSATCVSPPFTAAFRTSRPFARKSISCAGIAAGANTSKDQLPLLPGDEPGPAKTRMNDDRVDDGASWRWRWRRSAACTPPIRIPASGACWCKDGRIVGEGWHERAGEAHAEVHALRAAGAGRARRNRLRHARTLQPSRTHAALRRCADRGGRGRGSCAPSRIRIRSVAGGGLTRLRAAGIAVGMRLDGRRGARAERRVLLAIRAGPPVHPFQAGDEPGCAHGAGGGRARCWRGSRRRTIGSPTRPRAPTCKHWRAQKLRRPHRCGDGAGRRSAARRAAGLWTVGAPAAAHSCSIPTCAAGPTPAC